MSCVVIENPLALDRIKLLKKHWEEAKQHLLQAQEQQSKYANKYRREISFQLGDRVMLSTENINLKEMKQTRKLLSRYIGPYKIIEVLSPLNYRLELPPSLRIHPVFHICKLKLYHDESTKFPTRIQDDLRPLPELLTNGEEEWEVKKIVGKRTRRVGRTRKERIEYLVIWEGYPEYEKTWEPEENLINAKERVEEYLKSL